jgi:hypothetical protein
MCLLRGELNVTVTMEFCMRCADCGCCCQWYVRRSRGDGSKDVLGLTGFAF